MAGNQEAFNLAMNQGHSAAWDQQWDRAAGFYRHALEEFPTNPTAFSSLGLALFEMQEYEQALQCYQAAAQANVGDPAPIEKAANIYERMGKSRQALAAFLQSAELYLKMRDVDKAIDNWKRVLNLDPANLTARTRLALVFDKMGRKKEAIGEYLPTASIMQQRGDFSKAIQVVEYCLKLMPDSPEAASYLIMLRNNQLLPKAAPPKGSTARMIPGNLAQLNPPTPEIIEEMDPISEARKSALAELAALLFEQAEDTIPEEQVNRQGVGSLARGTGGLSAEQDNRTRILILLGQAIDAQTTGKDLEATEDLERAVEIGLNNSSAYFELGLLNSDRDDARALRYLQRSVKNPDYAQASYLLMGGIYLRGSHFSEAAVAFLQALSVADTITVAPDQGDELRQLYEPLIEAQMREKNPEALKKVCRVVSEQLLRSDWRWFLRLARQQAAAQFPDMPQLPLAENLIESSSSQVIEALARVRGLASEHKTYTALEELYYILQYAPTYLPIHIQIGDLLIGEGRVQEAVDKFLLVAELYNLRGGSTQAVQLLLRVTQMVPMDLSVRGRLINLLADQGRTEEALQQYMNLGEIYYNLAELEMARQTYTSAYKLAQANHANRAWSVLILNKIADIELQKLQYRTALRVYEQIRTLQPEDASARIQLVNLYLRMGQTAIANGEMDSFTSLLENSGKRVSAIEFLKKVLEDNLERVEIRKRLAAVYAHGHMIAEAVRELELASDQLLSNGDKIGARALLMAIINLHPTHVADYEKALRTLDQK